MSPPAAQWLLFSYRVPRHPSRLRLTVWRRLKRLGALGTHDALWLLPNEAEAREQLEWLAEEIDEGGGAALIWEAASLSTEQDARLIESYRTAADARYHEIATAARTLISRLESARGVSLKRVRRAQRELAALERAFKLEQRREHFRIKGRRSVGATLRNARHVLNARSPRRPSRRADALDNQATLSR